METPVNKHNVASDLCLHCLPKTLYGFHVRMGKGASEETCEEQTKKTQQRQGAKKAGLGAREG